MTTQTRKVTLDVFKYTLLIALLFAWVLHIKNNINDGEERAEKRVTFAGGVSMLKTDAARIAADHYKTIGSSYDQEMQKIEAESYHMLVTPPQEN